MLIVYLRVYMNKFKKIFSMVILFLMFFLVSGCSLLDKFKTKIVNEIQNVYVDYNQQISVTDIEDALVIASEVAKSCSVGVKIKSTGLFATEASGSGVIIKKEKLEDDQYLYYVVTNRHVTGTKKDTGRSVYLGKDENGNGIYIKANLVTYDSVYDLSLLSFTSGILLNVATINQQEIKEGKFAIAVGCPYELEGFYNSVNVGSISCPSRIYQDEDINKNVVYNTFIQHDASINSGNSGGGLFDIYGNLIGINTWKIASSMSDDYVGLNFAIPIIEVVNRFSNYL